MAFRQRNVDDGLSIATPCHPAANWAVLRLAAMSVMVFCDEGKRSIVNC